MKQSKYKKWSEKFFTTPLGHTQDLPVSQYAWNAAIEAALKEIKSVMKVCRGFPQHEDLDIIEYNIENLIEK